MPNSILEQIFASTMLILEFTEVRRRQKIEELFGDKAQSDEDSTQLGI
jgi:hypothetical protein